MSNENVPENIDDIPTTEMKTLIKESISVSEKLYEEDGTNNFLPTESYTWYYSLRDLTDEIVWGVVFLAVCAGFFFPYPTTKNGLFAYNILTALFTLGVLYFSVIHNPLKIFFRKEDVKFPNNRNVGVETFIFCLFLLGCAVALYRIPANFNKARSLTEEVAQEVESATAPETTLTVAPTESEESATSEMIAEPATESTIELESVAEPTEMLEVPETIEPEQDASVLDASVETQSMSTAIPVENGDVTTETEKKWIVGKWIHHLLLVAFGLFTLGYWINLAVRIFFNRICTSYTLTPVVMVCRSGFFVRSIRQIAIWDIAQVNVSRNLWQRMLRIGTVELRIRDHQLENTDENSDVPDNIVLIHGLSAPEDVKDKINAYRLFIRRRMGRRFLNHITK